ncbi:PAS domain-containing protein [Hymenobacter sp. HD11105]
MLSVFNAQPGANLLLSPEWVIVGASDDYLAATLTQRATIVGQFIFDAFPDNPATPEANGVAKVRASLLQVLATKQPHEMAPQHYDVPDPAQPGRFVERHWLPRHTPVLDAARQVQFIIQSVQDITARRRAERLLRDSQASERDARAEAEQQREELRQLFEQAPVALAVFRGPSHVVEMANPTVLRMWGRTSTQALNTPLFELLPETSGQGYEELLAGVLATGQPYVAHEMPSFIDREGRRDTVYWNFVYQPLRGADGQVTGVTVVAAEVTEQVLARQQLQQLNQELEASVFERTQALRHARADAEAATQRLLRVTESLPSTTFTTDARGQVLYLSPQWYAYTGMAPGAPVTEAWPTFIHPDDLPVIAREYGAALAEGRPWSYEFRLRGADGQYRWFASQGVPEPLADAEAAGRPRLWYGANLDVHDLLQARRALEQQEQRMSEILGQAPAMIATFEGPDHRFAFTNPGYDALVGHRARLGVPLTECFPEAAHQGFISLLDGIYRTGEAYVGRETPTELQPPGGEPALYYLDLVYQPLRDGQGHTTGILTFLTDATERVQARLQAEALQAQVLAAAQQQAQERLAFYHVFEQSPAVVALLRAPGHRYEYVNPAYQALFPGRQLVGLDLAVAAPELVAQGYKALIDQVYQTGETFFGTEQPFTPTPAAGQPARTCYFNFTFQAYREAGEIAGISILAYDVTEQVLTRQQREAEREQLHKLFMDAPAPIVILDGPALVYQLVNPAYQRIFPGRTLLGKPLLEALPEMAGIPLLDDLQRVYETGETLVAQELPLRLARHDGGPLEEIYWTFTYQARRNAAGEVDGVLVFAHEVTDQVQARRVVEEGELRVRSLVEAAPFPIGVFVGPDLHIQFANQAILDGWGKGSDVIGQRFADVLPELENQAIFEQAQQVYATGEALHKRNQRVDVLMHGQLQIFYYHYSFLPLRDAAGRVYGVMNTAADVTDVAEARLRVEQFAAEVQESEQRFRIMADAAPNMVWAVHPDSTIRYINRAFVDFVGVSQEEYRTSGWGPYMHPEEMARVQQVLTDAIAQRRVYSLEHRMRRHDGEYRWLQAQGAPSYFPNGELYGYVGSAIDITDLKQANEQLTRTNVDLDNFIYTASHDLKAPISNIEGLLYLLQAELPTEVVQDAAVGPTLTRMLDAVERFKRTIDHLTEVSKLQKENAPATTLVNLAAVVEDVRQDLVPLLQETGTQLVVEVAATPPIHFAEKNLRSLVYNLLSNAVKYRHPDRTPHVDVRAHVRDGHTVLEVHDNGLGLDPTHLPKLFTMFQRFHDHVEGTGIGLYMVKRMVDNAGGRIEVHSQLGAGTTFLVFLPHADSPAGQPFPAYLPA